MRRMNCVTIGILLACSLSAWAQGPKVTNPSVEGVLEGISIWHDEKPIVIIKNDAGQWQIFRLQPRENKKEKTPYIVSGSTVTLSFGTDDPNLVTAVTTKVEAKTEPAIYIDQRLRWVKFAKMGKADDQIIVEDRSGQIRVVRLEKDCKVVVGRTAGKLSEIKPETSIVLVAPDEQLRTCSHILMLSGEQKKGVFDKFTGNIQMARLVLQDKSEYPVQGNIRLMQVSDAKGNKFALETLPPGGTIVLNLTSDRKTVTAVTLPTVMRSGVFKALALKDGKTRLTLADDSSFELAKDTLVMVGTETKMARDLQPNMRLKLTLTPDEKTVVSVWAAPLPKKGK